MNRFRPISMSFVVIACLFLVGFKKPLPSDHPPTHNKPVGNDKDQFKPLDLSLPLQTVNLDGSLVAPRGTQHQVIDALTTNNKSKTRSFELQGRLIMTQEPELEKTKTADGAGIVINLHH